MISKDRLIYWWHKILIVALSLHSVYGLVESLRFIFIEHPRLELLLSQHLITTEELSRLTITAILLMVTTTINIALALRLHSKRDELAEELEIVVELIVVTLILFGGGIVSEWLVKLNLFERMGEFVLKILA